MESSPHFLSAFAACYLLTMLAPQSMQDLLAAARGRTQQVNLAGSCRAEIGQQQFETKLSAENYHAG